jgi:hypothetical protein
MSEHFRSFLDVGSGEFYETPQGGLGEELFNVTPILVDTMNVMRLGALLRIRSDESSLDHVWRSLRLLYGGIQEILRVLASTFRTSLLPSYPNLEHQPATKQV